MFRLKELREKTGVMQKEVAAELGIERSLYGKYENERSEPPYSVLVKMADYFGVTLDYLLGRTDAKSAVPEAGTALSADELQLLNDYRELNADGQRSVRTMVRSLVTSGAYIKSHISGQTQIG